MKQNKLNKITIVLMLITLLVVLVGILALARYTTSVNGGASAQVASWSFAAKDKNGSALTTTSKLDITETMNSTNSKVANGHIAPGTSGSFKVKVDASGSDVAVLYSVVLKNFKTSDGTATITIPKNLKFYSDSAHNNQLNLTSGEYKLEGNIAYRSTTGAMVKDVEIFWEWPFETAGDGINTVADHNAQDTADQGKDFICDVVVSGQQADPRS